MKRGDLFFERFREALSGYADGVHRLGEPVLTRALEAAARRLGAPLPPEYASFLRSWDGADLFHEDVRLFPIRQAVEQTERLRQEEGAGAGRLAIGESVAGDRIELATKTGYVHEVEADSGLSWRAASSLGRYLDRVMALGKPLYDRDGEFREDVFEGDELVQEIELARARAAVKVDAESPKARYELGKALERAGKGREAERALEAAVKIDPQAVWAGFDLGILKYERGAIEEAEQTFASAAEADPSHEHAGFFAAWAARAAAARGDEVSRSVHSARAQVLEPGIVARQLQAAEHEHALGRKTEALELVELALALAPRDLAALDLKRRAGRR